MQLTTFSSFVALLSLCGSALGDATYWVDPTCAQYGDMNDAIKEAIWNAGEVGTALFNQEPFWEDRLEWMFGFRYDSVEPASGVYNWRFVAYTFNRIGLITPAATRAEAKIRIYCDNDTRYRAVNSDGSYMAADPSPSDPNYATTLFYDVNNDSLVVGKELSCKKSAQNAQGAYAHTIENLNERYEAFRGGIFPQPSGDFTDRVTISLCARLWAGDNSQKLYTIKALSRKRLLGMKITDLSPNAMITITHELAHVSVLSSTTLTEPSGNDVPIQMNYPLGRDFHPWPIVAGSVQGYYRSDNPLTPGEYLGNRHYTIMNPDSYAYLAALYRLYGKRWSNQRQADGYIRLGVDRSLNDVGDWPA